MITLKTNMAATQSYYSLILIVRDMKLKQKIFVKILVRITKFLILIIIQLNKKYDNSKNLVVDKMKDEMGDEANEGFVGLKPKMYSILIDDSSEHKKAKGLSTNFVRAVSHSKHRHSLNRVQSKNHKIAI